MSERRYTQKLRPAEALTVTLICLFMLAVIPLACRRTRSDAYRMTCGTNLSGLGKAMLIYSNDYDDELPRSGGRKSIWANKIPDWRASSRNAAYGIERNGDGGVGSISSCFYLLVKYAEVTPRSFVCKQDVGTSEFKPGEEGAGDVEVFDLWDFGNDPTKRCSYSYHMPFGKYPMTTSNEPGMAVAADRNPYIVSPMGGPKNMVGFNPNGDRNAVKVGNAIQHGGDGQNVLFLDSHVAFEKTPFCGINDDNIYTCWDGGDIRRGAQPVLVSQPQDRMDSLLVHDGP